jgi:hypothetical protein
MTRRIMFYQKTKRQKEFLKILKYTKSFFDCDGFIEKVKGRYEFNVYHNSKEDVKKILHKYDVDLISVSDEGGDFVVVREIKPHYKEKNESICN